MQSSSDALAQVPPSLKSKTCTRKVHNGVERVSCDTSYTGSTCPNKSNHIAKIKSGYCGIGSCEGKRPENAFGEPLKTCHLFAWCSCECHAIVDLLYKTADKDRKVVENPNYIPKRANFVMPELVINQPIVDPLLTMGQNPTNSPKNPASGPPMAREGDGDTQPNLVNSRPAMAELKRGGLEARVWEQCRIASSQSLEFTPKVIGELIVAKYNIPTPSAGAIGAVFDRWEDLGFAERGKKPVRFIRFIKTGTWEELEQLKAVQKRAKKFTKTRNRRGF